MAISDPYPLFPTYPELKDYHAGSFKALHDRLNELPPWCATQWDWGKQFLVFIGRNKSDHTFIRFRSEIEKFMLWCFLVADKPLDQMRKSDILDYIEFFYKPPLDWIGLANLDKFIQVSGDHQFNPEWRPFRYISQGSDTDRKKYRPSQESLKSVFTALNVFYSYLMDEELCLGNPSLIARKDCKRLIKDAQIGETKRLDQDQWQFLLDTAQRMADEDSLYERNLFLMAAMKVLFLRISELSERSDWVPVMSHFWQDQDKNWWLKVFGKGRKLRDISVPDSFLSYLERYRLWRGLSARPGMQEKEPIVEKIRGAGGMTARQLARLVEQVLLRAYDDMLLWQGKQAAQIFKDVSPHWLRHTGASMEIDRGRALKDVSEDLGHASMATTDTVYVRSAAKNRAKSGKQREV
ncbi:MAG: tyrosine-type recombinase/integrase [Hahellaceae bacterium]|nr:tyrosine-type recombinase/integrase [Hahellaceae bacterium]